MQSRHYRSTLLDFLAPWPGESACQCLRRAALCSRMAKLCTGRLRRKLYRLKNMNIRAALRCSDGAVEVHADLDRYVGLLSVRLTGAPAVRVHTHENWIDAA